jgi:hypothetical protein
MFVTDYENSSLPTNEVLVTVFGYSNLNTDRYCNIYNIFTTTYIYRYCHPQNGGSYKFETLNTTIGDFKLYYSTYKTNDCSGPSTRLEIHDSQYCSGSTLITTYIPSFGNRFRILYGYSDQVNNSKKIEFQIFVFLFLFLLLNKV